MCGQFVGLIISFIARIIFINVLGNEYLGLNGLFTNILNVLSLAELGIGTAITYNLYKPLSEKDETTCKMLMQFYKKVYTIIGIIILLLGSAITPFLSIFIKEIPNINNINLIYILFVINTSVSYFFSYKRNLIISDQQRYIATIYRYGIYALMNIIQIIYLLISKDYIGFLIIQIGCTLLENILVSKKADKMYPYLKDKKEIPLDINMKESIIDKTKALLMHRIGGIVVNSTDNIILSKCVGLTAVGLYSNYYLIISSLNTIISQVYNSITASIGNLFAVENKNKIYDIFKKVNFLTFWIYAFCSICLMILLNTFIELWIGKKYIFEMKVVIILVVNFFFTGMRKSVLTFRDAAGLFEKDKYKSIFESMINLIASIILALKFGTFGVFLGTFISTISVCFWIEPYVLFKYGFEKNASIYFVDYVKKIILLLFALLITCGLCNLIKGATLVKFIYKLIVCLLVPNIIIVIFYFRTDEFMYFLDLVKNKILKVVKKA